MPGEGSRSAVFTEDFHVGEWLVQPSLDRLVRGDTLVHLRPQLTDLLLLLCRHAGRPVPKEQILQEVWATQYVGDSVLTRCITELRQALDDDARQPKVLETVHKRGYRIVAPVVALPPDVRPGIGGNGNGHGPGTPGAATASGEPVPGAAPGVGAAPRPASSPRSRLRPAPWVVAGLIAAVSLAVALARSRSGGPLPSGRNTVLVADVANATGDAVFDDTLSLALAVNVEQAPFLRVLSREQVRAGLARMHRPADEPVVGSVAHAVCRREGAAVLLTASIRPLGSRYTVGVEATACESGESIAHALEEAGDREHVLAALGRAAAAVRRRLGDSRATLVLHGTPLVRATTPSLDALKALTAGDDNRDHGCLDEALSLYRQATEIDPGFALAWARRGAAAWNLSLWDEAIQAFRRAYELRERVSQPEKFYIEGHYYRVVVGDYERAIEAYRAWRRMYPGSVVPPTNLASILSGAMGQYEAAIAEAREAVRLAPYSSVSLGNLVYACRSAGRIAEARLAIADGASRGVEDFLIRIERLALALLEGDPARIEEEARRASADPLAAIPALRLRASAAMAGGRLREARALWSEAVVKADQVATADRAARICLYHAEAEALLGTADAARAAVDAALDRDRAADTRVIAAIVLALAGDHDRAEALLHGVVGQPSRDPAGTKLWLQVAQALAEAGQKHPGAAMRLLNPVVPFERGGQFQLVPIGVRGIVHAAAGRPADAAAAFADLLHLRAIEPVSPWVAFAQVAGARALRDAGDTASSLAAYDAFLESWRDADPDVTLLETVRRERAAIAGALL